MSPTTFSWHAVWAGKTDVSRSSARIRCKCGGTRWVEEIVAWDEDTRWAWTVVRTSLPFATAQVESFELTDAGVRTRVRWTLALEPRLVARLGAPFFGRTLARVLHRAMDNLGTYLGQTAARDA